jgi:predicted dehydrogenase
MKLETIGVGFIGAGWMARAHGHALHTLNHVAPLSKRVRLVAIAGRRREVLERRASDLGFERRTTRWQEVVEDDEVDVVAILAPTHLHAAPTIAALELGKPVLCEKPLGRDAAEAQEMLAAAQAAGVPHCCGFNYRFVPAVRLARRLVADGRLGRLRHFRAVYLQDWAADPDVARSWRFERGGASGAVTDYAHIVDLLRHLSSEPVSVSAEVALFIDRRPSPDDAAALLPVEVEDAYAAVLQLEGGAVASLEASRCATGWKGRQQVEVNGSDGSLWWNMEDLNRLHVLLTGEDGYGTAGFRDVLVTEPEHPFLRHWWAPGHILGWEHTFVHQWRDFLRVVLEQATPEDLPKFEDGYRAAVVCDAILAAAASGRREEVASLELETRVKEEVQ